MQARDTLDLIEKESGEIFAKATIISVYEKQLQDIEEADFEGHEKFDSNEHMHETYRGYYGDKVTPETLVKIIQFETLKRDNILQK